MYAKLQPPAALASVTAGWVHVTRPVRGSAVHAPPLTSSVYMGPCGAAALTARPAMTGRACRYDDDSCSYGWRSCSCSQNVTGQLAHTLIAAKWLKQGGDCVLDIAARKVYARRVPCNGWALPRRASELLASSWWLQAGVHCSGWPKPWQSPAPAQRLIAALLLRRDRVDSVTEQTTPGVIRQCVKRSCGIPIETVLLLYLRHCTAASELPVADILTLEGARMSQGRVAHMYCWAAARLQLPLPKEPRHSLPRRRLPLRPR